MGVKKDRKVDVYKMTYNVDSRLHVHAGSNATVYYVPDFRQYFGAGTSGTFGSPEVFINNKEEIIADLEAAIANDGRFDKQGENSSTAVRVIRKLSYKMATIMDIICDLKVAHQARVRSEESYNKFLTAICIYSVYFWQPSVDEGEAPWTFYATLGDDPKTRIDCKEPLATFEEAQKEWKRIAKYKGIKRWEEHKPDSIISS